MIEVKCPHCGALQKVDENKFEVPCKKCKESFNVEEGIDLLVSGAQAAAKIKVEDAGFDVMLERGLGCLAAESYAGARAFLEKALEREPENAQALWAMCRAVMCAPEIEPDPECLRYLDGDRTVCGEYAARENCTEAKAEFDLRRRLRAAACYTDEESDEYFERARAAADDDFGRYIEDCYALYSYAPEEDSAVSENADLMNASFRDVPPNFGAERPVIGWKLILATVLSLLATVGAVVLLALKIDNGWVIALLVLGLVASLFCSVGIMVDNKRQIIRKILTRYMIVEIAELAQAVFRCTSPEEAENATKRCAALIGSMIYGGQLTYIGMREGRYLDYYDESCQPIPAEASGSGQDPFDGSASEAPATADASDAPEPAPESPGTDGAEVSGASEERS